MLMLKSLRVAVATVGVLGAMLTFDTVSATAQVQVTCPAAVQAHATALEARLARLQQTIDARNAKIADGGNDLSKVSHWEAGLTRARRHHDRINARLEAITQACQN